MGFFGRRKASDSASPPTEKPVEPLAQGGSDSSVGPLSDADSAKQHQGGLFARRSHSSDGHTSASSSSSSSRLDGPAPLGPSRAGTKASRKGKSGGSLFGSSKGSAPRREHIEVDPVILDARERIEAAEAAEAEADKALEEARMRVREARDYASKIEEEAKEEARRAQLKAYHASEVSKRGGQLGRHGE